MDCPVCGHPMRPPRGLTLTNHTLFSDSSERVLRLDGAYVQEAILRALLRGLATAEALVEVVYGNADDTPQDPRAMINATITHLRPKLQLMGWTINNKGAQGGDALHVIERDEPGKTGEGA